MTKSILGLDKDLKEARTELAAFEHLRQLEAKAAVQRKQDLEQEVSVQERRQTDLQNRYRDLVQQLETLRA